MKDAYGFQVLEPNWHVMHTKLQRAKSIDEVGLFFSIASLGLQFFPIVFVYTLMYRLHLQVSL